MFSKRLGAMTGACLLVLTAAVAGCSAGPPPVQPDPRWSAATSAALRTMSTQPREAGIAEAGELRNCLRRQGFDPPLPLPDVGGTANLPVILSVSAARADGYGDAIRDTVQADSRSLERYAASLPVDVRAAFEQSLDSQSGRTATLTTPNGWVVKASRSGCSATARSRVYGSVENWLLVTTLPQDLNATAADVYLDSRVRRALAIYQPCMVGRGVAVAYPQEAFERAEAAAMADGHDRSRASAAERRLATADATCQAASGLGDAVDQAFEDGARDWASDNADLVERAAVIIDDAVRQARR